MLLEKLNAENLYKKLKILLKMDFFEIAIKPQSWQIIKPSKNNEL